MLNRGTLALQGSVALYGDGFSGFFMDSLLHNAGTVVKTGAAGTSAEIQMPLDNDGAIDVSGGGSLTLSGHLLNLSGGGFGEQDAALTGGTFAAAADRQTAATGL